MKTAKPEFRNPKEARSPKFEASAWPARIALECGGKRSATPLSRSQLPDAQLDPRLRRIPKRRRRFSLPANSKACQTLAAAFAIALLSAFTTHAQSYSIDWFKIAGGGGTSTGGTYFVSGTIGQPDASGPMTNGQYSIIGGFWSIVAVQTPGSPLLRVFATSSNAVVVAWPAPSTGFKLQDNTNLATTNWANVTNVPAVVGAENHVIAAPGGQRFYRLRNP